MALESTTNREHNESTYQDLVQLTGQISTTYESESAEKIHTRVMVEDTSALGYVIDDATIAAFAKFSSFNEDVFLYKLKEVYPEIISSGDFITKITAETSDTANNDKIILTSQQGNTYVIGDGNVSDAAFQQEMLSWGIEVGPLYALVSFYTDATMTQTRTVKVSNQTDLLTLSPGETLTSGWLATINEERIPCDRITEVVFGDIAMHSTEESDVTTGVALPVNALAFCTNLRNVSMGTGLAVSIPSNFCRECQNLETAHLPTLGGQFFDNIFYNCTRLHTITQFPTTMLGGIGKNFLYNCTSLNCNLALPSTWMGGTDRSYKIDEGFMHNCNSMTSTINTQNTEASYFQGNLALDFSCVDSTAPVYVQGITITGNKASGWLSALPNRTTSPYRKLKSA